MDIRKFLFKTTEFDVEKSLPDATFCCAKDGKIQWVNDKAAEVFETSKMHLLTSNINDFIENALLMVQNAISRDSIIITKSVNAEIYYDMTAKEIEDGFVVSFRDVKNQDDAKAKKEEDDSYKEINRDKNSFLVKLTNDFKSPLQSIVGFSQAMSDGLGGTMSEQQEKYINIIRKNSSELMYFITKLLDLSQTEADTKIPECKTFNIVNTINSISKFNEQLYKDKELTWKPIIQEGIKNTIVSNEDVLKLILQNIIDVIVKSVDIGEIKITLSSPAEDFYQDKNLPADEYVLISLSSSSMLLSDNDLESMFDPYKIIDTTNRKNLLRAIILASVKNYVKSLNGFIWVESEVLKTTSFNILIPANKI